MKDPADWMVVVLTAGTFVIGGYLAWASHIEAMAKIAAGCLK